MIRLPTGRGILTPFERFEKFNQKFDHPNYQLNSVAKEFLLFLNHISTDD